MTKQCFIDIVIATLNNANIVALYRALNCEVMVSRNLILAVRCLRPKR